MVELFEKAAVVAAIGNQAFEPPAVLLEPMQTERTSAMQRGRIFDVLHQASHRDEACRLAVTVQPHRCAERRQRHFEQRRKTASRFTDDAGQLKLFTHALAVARHDRRRTEKPDRQL